jgi:ribosomal protein S6--L-glutamate ligase
MRVGILISEERNEEFAGATRLIEAGTPLGHTVDKLYERRFAFRTIDGALAVTYDGATLPQYDAIIVRANFIEEPTLHQYVYDFLELAGYKLINTGAAITKTKNKLLQRRALFEAGIPLPKWTIAFGANGCRAAVKEFGYPLVLKVAFGTKGKGVFFANSSETFFPVVDYLALRDGNPVILEEFIEEASKSHIRAFVVGDEVAASCEFTSPPGDIRTNASYEGECLPAELSDDEKVLAVKATQALGLDIGGVDLIRTKNGPLILEVNANPGFDYLEKVSGVDVAKKIIEFSVK